METVFRMAQVQRAKRLPRVSLTLLCKLQYTGITRTKVTSTTAHLFSKRDGMGRIRKKNTLKRLVSGTEMKRRLRSINGFILGNEDASTIQLR